MQAKALEVRDEGTFIALLAVNMNPVVATPADRMTVFYTGQNQGYLLRRVGYPCDGHPNILITKLSGDGSKASNDPHYWGDRTFAVAHAYIIENWTNLKDGDVIDVQWILGETGSPKITERLSSGG